MPHCAACGEGVQSYEVDLGGVTETRCASCGLPLQRRTTTRALRFRRVLLADDSAFFTEGLKGYLVEKGLCNEVTVAGDGAAALGLATAALRERAPYSLVVLDLLMPRLNGIHAAVALRSVERAFGGFRSPILFLSSRRIDPSLKPLLDELQPAFYLNKSSGGPLFDGRLEEVLQAVAPGRHRA
ncbi:MAG: response regulator [Deferrisomatales bacterium]|nr:response regulator [Deferrisomatales bacterium]